MAQLTECQSWIRPLTSLWVAKGKTVISNRGLRMSNYMIWLPYSLLHLPFINKDWRIVRWHHHKPEGHSGSLIAHNNVGHAVKFHKTIKSMSVMLHVHKTLVMDYIMGKKTRKSMQKFSYLNSCPLKWLLMAKARIDRKRNISLSSQSYWNDNRSCAVFSKTLNG